MTPTEVDALRAKANQLDQVMAVLVELGADEAAAERDPAWVLREMLQTWKFMSQRAAPPAPDRPRRLHFDHGFRPTLNQLVPGVTVRRWTEHDRDYAHTQIPCCDRPVRLPLDPGMAPHLYGCPFCAKAYKAALIDESDGGYSVLFTVHEETFVVIGRRKPKKGEIR